MTCYLYVIMNLVNGKQYYGQTLNYQRRWSNHKSGYGSKLVYRAIKKYGLENFEFKVVCIASEKEVKRLEQLIIQEKHSKVPLGYNLSDGGEGESGWKLSKERKEEISLINKGKKFSKETRKKMSLSQTGRKHNKETRKKMSLSQIGRKHSKETRKKMVNSSIKPVLINGIKYKSIKDAAFILGYKYSTLRMKFGSYQKNNNFPIGWGYLTPRR